MASAVKSIKSLSSDWSWPVDINLYDRRTELTSDERIALEEAKRRRESGNAYWLKRASQPLCRLLSPLEDTLTFLGLGNHPRVGLMNLLLMEMLNRGISFWGWGSNDWVEVIGIDCKSFEKRPGVYKEIRQPLMAVSYLLCGCSDLTRYGHYYRPLMASRIFGQRTLDSVIQRVREELERIGYGDAIMGRRLRTLMSTVLLINRSPRLEDITFEVLERVRQSSVPKVIKQDVVALSGVLRGMGIISKALPKHRPELKEGMKRSVDKGVPRVWAEWCERWRETSTLEPKTIDGIYYILLKVGRWLANAHPEAVHPGKWTRDITVDFLAAIQKVKIGEWSPPNKSLRGKVGKPLSPRTQSGTLAAVRIFFNDCQERDWIPRRFSPERALKTPKSILGKIAPDPRIIQDDIWAKLLWAGLNLTQDDLNLCVPFGYSEKGYLFYPIKMVRAIALVWLLCGLRVNEITRLRVGCVRWQRENVTVPLTGNVLKKDEVCFLEVPISKTNTTFTKPVDCPAGEAIEEWEKIRPDQRPALDNKTGEMVNFLFSYRGKCIGIGYINESLIPILRGFKL